MTAKEYLGQAFYLDKRINSLTAQCSDLRKKALTVKSSSDFREKVAGGSNSANAIIDKIVDFEQKINAEIDELVNLKAEIKRKIEAVEDDVLRLILSERYLNFKKWEQIAVDNEIDLRWIYRLHKKALAEIQV